MQHFTKNITLKFLYRYYLEMPICLFSMTIAVHYVEICGDPGDGVCV